MSDLLFIFGTRPEAIKIGPVVAELHALGIRPALLCTGQHTTLLRGTPIESDLRHCDSLDLMSDGNVERWIRVAHGKLNSWFERFMPKTVVVQGDTMSAYAGATMAELHGVPLAHIEAGVRSHNANDPWPEEESRIAISRIAQYHYAPTTMAFANLGIEDIRTHVYLTGNPVVSALARYTSVMPVTKPDDTVLVTLHRREVQTKAKADTLYRAVVTFASRNPHLRILWPMHPAFKALVPQTSLDVRVQDTGPMRYADFAESLACARLVITDSGGVVEEAASLGVPTLIVRNTNDRPEAVAAGIATTCKTEGDALLDELPRAMALPRQPTAVFGLTDAAAQIARYLAKRVKTV